MVLGWKNIANECNLKKIISLSLLVNNQLIENNNSKFIVNLISLII